MKNDLISPAPSARVVAPSADGSVVLGLFPLTSLAEQFSRTFDGDGILTYVEVLRNGMWFNLDSING